MRFDIVTIFPDALASYLNTSILRRARERGIIQTHFHTPRDFTKDKRRTVDGKPYGGGAGMVMMAEPILRAVEKISKMEKIKSIKKTKVVLLSAKGKQFNQRMAYDWAKKFDQLVLISGRYEGIDERVKIALKAEEISVGPYVLTDGEVAAMAVISAVGRLVPGVIRLASLQEESHWNLLLKKERGAVRGRGLEYPHYTRPEVLRWKGKAHRVPKVLLSGDHHIVEFWRQRHAK